MFQSWNYSPAIRRTLQKYSSSHKSSIFCFAQLLLQILVNYQNQGQFWNLLVLRISKHSLKVKSDLDPWFEWVISYENFRITYFWKIRTLLVLESRGCPSLYHWTLGRGTPVTWQTSSSSSPSPVWTFFSIIRTVGGSKNK